MSDLRAISAPKPDPRIRYIQRLQGPWGTYVSRGSFPMICDYGNGTKPGPLRRWYLKRRLRRLDRLASIV